MTSTVTEMTVKVITFYNYNILSSTVGVVVIELLIGLLLQKELLRAFNDSRFKAWMQALDIAIVPLFLTFSLIVTVRLLNLLP